jgi:hypothetical protein
LSYHDDCQINDAIVQPNNVLIQPICAIKVRVLPSWEWCRYFWWSFYHYHIACNIKLYFFREPQVTKKKQRKRTTTNVEEHAFPKYQKPSFVLSVLSKCDVTFDPSGLYFASNFTPCPGFSSSKKKASVLNEEYWIHKRTRDMYIYIVRESPSKMHLFYNRLTVKKKKRRTFWFSQNILWRIM